MTNTDRYHVELECNENTIVVHQYRNHVSERSIIVNRPWWIERIFGATFEKRVRSERDRCERICKRRNKRLDEAEQICKTVEELSN